MFKVYDKVRCLRGYHGFTKGDVYTFIRDGGKISLIDDGGNFRPFMGNWSDHSWSIEFVKVEGSMSQYEEIKRKIEGVSGFSSIKYVDDIMVEIREADKTKGYFLFIPSSRDGRIHIYDCVDRSDFKRASWANFSFTNQCQKIIAIKNALMWLLDHADISKIVGKTMEVRINGKSYMAEIVREV